MNKMKAGSLERSMIPRPLASLFEKERESERERKTLQIKLL